MNFAIAILIDISGLPAAAFIARRREDDFDDAMENGEKRFQREKHE